MWSWKQQAKYKKKTYKSQFFIINHRLKKAIIDFDGIEKKSSNFKIELIK